MLTSIVLASEGQTLEGAAEGVRHVLNRVGKGKRRWPVRVLMLIEGSRSSLNFWQWYAYSMEEEESQRERGSTLK